MHISYSISSFIKREYLIGWFLESSPALIFLTLHNLFGVVTACEEMRAEGNSPLLTIYLHELIPSAKPHLHNTSLLLLLPGKDVMPGSGREQEHWESNQWPMGLSTSSFHANTMLNILFDFSETSIYVSHRLHVSSDKFLQKKSWKYYFKKSIFSLKWINMLTSAFAFYYYVKTVLWGSYKLEWIFASLYG